MDDGVMSAAPAAGVATQQASLHPDQPLNLQPFWMPFTHNRYYKNAPRMFARAEGVHYWTDDGRKLFDGLSGLWCTPMGHCHPKIAEAIARQAKTLDYSPPFQMGHADAFRLADRILDFTPAGMSHVFFTNSGSEAVDTALKIALAYHRARGEGTRTRMVGRERGYHGVGIAGISVGGMVANRKAFSALMMPGVDHLPHTHNLSQMAYTRGMPTWGAHLADELERLVALHDASNIAAVIVEPMAGSTGVLVPPVGYLKRLREICDKHGILLVFDEVICGFGRCGDDFGAKAFGVTPDIITFAKAVNNGSVPMGGVIVREGIYDAFMTGPEHLVELFHGYTYSAHPLACAAALAALDVYESEGMAQRVRELAPVLEDVVHSLRGEPNVTDIRNIGMAAGIDLAPVDGKPGLRALQVFERCYQRDLYVRFSGDTLALGPSFVSTADDLHKAGETLRAAIRAAA